MQLDALHKEPLLRCSPGAALAPPAQHWSTNVNTYVKAHTKHTTLAKHGAKGHLPQMQPEHQHASWARGHSHATYPQNVCVNIKIITGKRFQKE